MADTPSSVEKVTSEWLNGVALRNRFIELGGMLDEAMATPQARAIPEVYDVLHLLCQGLMVLSRSVSEFMAAYESERT